MSVKHAIENHEFVQSTIREYIRNNQSFFILAGAGAGKTKSLVDTLADIKKTYKKSYLPKGQRVAVITYTENAAEEIKQRVGKDSLFRISTIHSFAWEIISKYKRELLVWVKKNKKEYSNVKKVEYTLQKSTEFVYRLKHNEVISIFSEMLKKYDLLKETLTTEYPLILVDEYQDTDKKVIDILLELKDFNANFTLGFFGDSMQRIYSSGYSFLEEKLIENNFKETKKEWNWRSTHEIVDFINKVRSISTDPTQPLRIEADSFIQKSVQPKGSGRIPQIAIVAEGTDPQLVENRNMKTLVLEHRMAAERMGFFNLFVLFNKNISKKDSFKEGTVIELKCLKAPSLELYDASRNIHSKLHLMKYMREYNYHFQENTKNGEEIQDKLMKLSESYREILSYFEKSSEVSLKEFSQKIQESELFYITHEIDFADDFWKEIGQIKLQEILAYFFYQEDMEFDTQHGSKGLEYDKVQVILSQIEAIGKNHNFNQLLRIQPLSETIKINYGLKKDTTLSRTQKLFYVAVSRARKELRIVWYVPKEQIQDAKENIKLLFEDACIIE
ncbi:UvrD-helicase domain-containing protein [Planococcus sp. SIMBA_160]